MIQTLLELALKSLLVAALGLGLLRLTRRRSASERSLIAHLTLAALVALPLVGLALPPLTLAVLDAPAVAPVSTVETSARVEPSLEAAGVGTVSRTRRVETATAPAPRVDWTPYAYAAPAAGLLLITLFALLRLFSLSRRWEVLVEPVWLSALAHAQRRMGFKSGTALLVSDALPSPISWGWARPVIVLNRQALAATIDAEAIIAHELAHVVALDWAKLMLARVATALYWFNPLVWGLAREAHQLREEAADDAVLAAAAIPDVDYAQLLVGVARHEADGLLLGAHGVAPGRDSLRRRVGRVLDSTLARAPAGRSWMAGFGTGMLVMTAPLAALTVAAKSAPERARPPVAAAVASTPTPTPTHGAPRSAPAPRAVASANGSTVATEADGETTTTHPDGTSVRVSAPDAHGRRQIVTRRADGTTARTTLSSADGRTVVTQADGTTVTVSAPDARGRQEVLIRRADGSTTRTTATVGRDDSRRDGVERSRARAVDDDIDEAIALKTLGVTPDYVAAIEAAAPWLGRVSADDAMEMRAVGITPEFVRDMASAGLRPSHDELVEARAVGVSGGYARAMAAAGYHGSVERLIEMRTVNVTPADLSRRTRAPRAAPRTVVEAPEPPAPPETAEGPLPPAVPAAPRPPG